MAINSRKTGFHLSKWVDAIKVLVSWPNWRYCHSSTLMNFDVTAHVMKRTSDQCGMQASINNQLLCTTVGKDE
jgi:hypothetical protein